MKNEVPGDHQEEMLLSVIDNQKQKKQIVNELLYKQKALFKILNFAIKRYSGLGFSIVFTGNRDLVCYSFEDKEKVNPCSFQLPAFSIVHKVPGFRKSDTSEIPLSLEEEVSRFRFTPKVTETGGISYLFQEQIVGANFPASGKLFWKRKDLLDDREYWFFNVDGHPKGLKDSPFDLKCMERLLLRMFTRNAITPN